MAYTLAYLDRTVPPIPSPEDAGEAAKPRELREHFGTEEAALRRATELLAGPLWLNLRLYGPDGRWIAGHAGLAERLGIELPDPDE